MKRTFLHTLLNGTRGQKNSTFLHEGLTVLTIFYPKKSVEKSENSGGKYSAGRKVQKSVRECYFPPRSFQWVESTFR